MTLLTDLLEEEQFLAGEYVACGTYQQIGTTIRFRFDTANYLPIPANGNMCAYLRVGDQDPISVRSQPFTEDVRRSRAA